MGETTIEWTATQLPDGTTLPGFTFNPWIGCQEVSPACDHCYAREFMTKKPRWATAWSGDRFRTSPDYWRQPLKWNREAERSGIRRKVFCASLADVFDNKVDPQWRDDLWRLIASTPHLDWLLLTKRPQNIAKMLPKAYGFKWLDWPYPNVWLGTTVENQEEGDRRIPHLLEVSAAVHFLSCEPLLGPLRLQEISLAGHHGMGKDHVMDTLRGESWRWGAEGVRYDLVRGHRRIKWIISGGESGPGARPSHPDWHRASRDQCAAAGVPFFFKQWGNWAPSISGRSLAPDGTSPGPDKWNDQTTAWMTNVGKKAAGALLDGVAHRGMPL